MGLFLKNKSRDRIMILGRWASRTFLVYIRPQVLERTNNMSRTMIQTNDFLDAPNLLAIHRPMNHVPALHPSMALLQS
jgi:hypothetical protein